MRERAKVMANSDESPEVLRLVAMLQRVQSLSNRISSLALRATAAERAIRAATEQKQHALTQNDAVALDAAGKALMTAEKAQELAATERKRYERERSELEATLAKQATSNAKLFERAMQLAGPVVAAHGQSPAPSPTPAQAGSPSNNRTPRSNDSGKESLDSPDFPSDWDLYEPRSLLGEGGMGRVYRVFHRGWGIDLAVKVPRKTALDAKAMRSVLREAEAWSSLGLHPFITSCYYARVRDGVPWLFAEFVDGGSVQQAVRSGTLYRDQNSLARILTIAIQSARGLHHAHERSLVHQDVKPANILLTQDGMAKVTDFGLARAALSPDTAGPRPTVEGTMIVRFSGMTPAYASPEQLASSQGREHAITRRTDLYSWAATVLEMFVGALTWVSGPAAVDALANLLDNGPKQPNIPSIPKEVADLLERCFAVRQSARPSTLAIVADELSHIYYKYCGGFLRDTSSLRQPPADALYNRGASRLDLGDVNLAAECWEQALHADPVHPHSIFARSIVEWRQGKISDDHAVRSLKEALASNEPSWENAHLLALLHAERGSVHEARSALAEMARLGASSKDAIAAVGRLSPAIRDLLQWDGELRTAGPITHTAISADGTLVAALSTIGDGQKLQVFTYDSRILAAEQTISGPVLALEFEGNHSVRALGTNHTTVWKIADHSLSSAASEPRQLVCASGLTTLSANGTTLQWTHPDHQSTQPAALVLSSPVVCLAISNHQTYGAVCTEDGQLLLIDLATARVLWRHRYARAPEKLSFSADEQTLCVGGWDDRGSRGILLVHDSKMGTIQQQIPSPHPPAALVVSSDDHWLIQLSANGILRLWSNDDLRWARTERSAQGPGRFRSLIAATKSNRIAIARESHIALATVGERSLRAAIPIVCPVRSEDVFAREHQAYTALTKCRTAVNQHQWQVAIDALDAAAAVEGFSRAPAVRRMWEQLALRTGRGVLRGAWTGVSFECPSGAAHTIELSPDGSVLYVVDGEHQLLALNSRSGAVIHKLLFTENIHTFQVSPATGNIVVAWGSHLEWIEPFTARSLQKISVAMKCRRMALSADGYSVVLVGTEGFEAHRVRAGKTTSRVFAAKSAQRAAWLSDDGPLLMSANGAELTVASFETGMVLGTIPNSAFAMDVVCSPDGAFVCAGHRDGWIRVWKTHGFSQTDMQPMELVSECASDAVISGVSLSQDGRVVVAVDATGRVQAWDVWAGKAFALGGHETFVHDVALTPCGRVAATGGRDGKARVLWLDWSLKAPEFAGWSEKCDQVVARFVTQGLHREPNAYRLLAWNLLHAGCGTISLQEIRAALKPHRTR